MTPNRAYLFAHWEGGGNTPPMLGVARRLVERGHRVHILSDLCHAAEVQAIGAGFSAWTRVPPRPDKSPLYDPLKDWEAKSPIEMLGRLRDRMFVGRAGDYAHDVLDALQRVPADAIVTSEMLLGVMAAAERAKVPCVALASNVYLFPRPGVPPFGPGFQPMRGPIGRVRDWVVRTMALRVIGRGTADYNTMRRDLGLAPVSHPFDQLRTVARSVVLTSAAFDFPASEPEPHLVYAGPWLEDPQWVESWTSPWSADDRRPLVIVGFSTTFQNQAGVLQRVIAALGALPVRAVVTIGPAIDRGAFTAPPNVHVCASAPHRVLLRDAALTITHAGHGTVIRSLAAGVPVLCMPMGRDQNENAARVAARGVGLRLSPGATVEAIQRAARTLLDDPGYRARAAALGAQIVEDARRSPAIDVLEEIASRHSAAAQAR
jgi:MGT family glycosyltransferase